MDTPRPRSPPPPPRPPRLLKPTTPRPPLPPPLSTSPSPSRDFSFAFSLTSPLSSPPRLFHGHHRTLPPLPAAADMSRVPVGRVGSDLSYTNYAKASHHPTTGHNSSSKDKSKASSFFSGHGSAWRSGECREARDAMAGNGGMAQEKRKSKAKRGREVGQWVKKQMASMVEHLLASFSRNGERERREQRRRPHSFSGHGPGAAAERERWRRRRGQLSSAPASLRASPANSGHLSVGASVKVSTSSEESTMEELQSAIEAAIAHCKKSTAVHGQAANTRRHEDRDMVV